MDQLAEAGRLMLTSKEWPPKTTPPGLRLKAGFTKTRRFRSAEVEGPDGRIYVLIESNPAKVGRDSEGNGPKDKVMVKVAGEEGWAGQVRRYAEPGVEAWHFHAFKEGGRPCFASSAPSARSSGRPAGGKG